mmetsp:Transcript_30222/g.39843  ORF Transcript_30222/g.39843 Transcript_30222/m.39843 type:complete len:583 (-) Transcript_30222:70-1818(-)
MQKRLEKKAKSFQQHDVESQNNVAAESEKDISQDCDAVPQNEGTGEVQYEIKSPYYDNKFLSWFLFPVLDPVFVISDRCAQGIVAPIFITLIFSFCVLMVFIPNIDDSLAKGDDEIQNIDSGNTAWMIVSTGLVLLMTPGLAFFYGGMVSYKNIISTLMQSFISMGIVTILWLTVGFSLAFGDSISGIIGNPSTYFLFTNVTLAPLDIFSPTIPFALYSMFQLSFAIITPALITGALAERMNFMAWMAIIPLWIIFVYCPLCHATWHPDGFLNRWGVLDFAGGTVVHMSSGFAGLVGSFVLGKRHKEEDSELGFQANLPFMMLGTALLWFGWFGFNGGSAVASNSSAVQAVLTTQVAAASAMTVWVLIDYTRGFKIGALNACCGAVVGLVVITPAAGFVSIGSAMLLGAIGACGCNLAVECMKESETDDALDAFGCHGVGGALGIFLTGCFAQKELGGADGLIFGGHDLFWKHCIVLVLVPIPVMVLTWLIMRFVGLFLPLRVSIIEERVGLDVAAHGEEAPLARFIHASSGNLSYYESLRDTSSPNRRSIGRRTPTTTTEISDGGERKPITHVPSEGAFEF